jgi:hypothetical protein
LLATLLIVTFVAFALVTIAIHRISREPNR